MNESPTDSPTDKDFSASYAPPGGRRSRPALLRYVGLCVFLVSFFLPALGGLGGFQSAFFGIIFVRPWQPDDKISPWPLLAPGSIQRYSYSFSFLFFSVAPAFVLCWLLRSSSRFR